MTTLGWTEFAGSLRSEEITFGLSENVGGDETGAGAAIRVGRGTRLWTGAIRLASDAENLRTRALEAQIEFLQDPGNAFLISPPHYFPAHDPTGSIVTGSSPTVTIGDFRKLTIAGLPEGYVITPGDWLGWQYGTPIRRALHRVRAGGTVDASRSLSGIEVNPPPVPATTRPVTLVRPVCKAVLVPDTFSGFAYLGGRRGGGAFRFRQVLP